MKQIEVGLKLARYASLDHFKCILDEIVVQCTALVLLLFIVFI